MVREETHCHHMGYSFWLAARVLLYASSLWQDNTYHSLCYTSCGSLAGMRNSSMGPTPWRIDPPNHRTMSDGMKDVFVQLICFSWLHGSKLLHISWCGNTEHNHIYTTYRQITISVFLNCLFVCCCFVVVVFLLCKT